MLNGFQPVRFLTPCSTYSPGRDYFWRKTTVIEMDLKRDERTLVQKLGEFLIRYGLVIVLGWIGFPALSGSGGFF